MNTSDPPAGSGLPQDRLDAVRCPHCDEVTMPNLLEDGSVVCSCTAERALPLDLVHGTPWDGEPAMPPADDRPADPHRGDLPKDAGQFGRDVETEDYGTLRRPPGG